MRQEKLSFERWMAEVNRAVVVRAGCWADDLPDCCYRDWYDDGVSASSAAKRAIRAAKEGD